MEKSFMNLQLHLRYSTGKPIWCVPVQFKQWAAATVFFIALLLEPTTRITKSHLQHVQNAVAPEVKQFTSSIQPKLRIRGAIPPVVSFTLQPLCLRGNSLPYLSNRRRLGGP